MENLTGKQFGQYQILAPLGQGGMAAVYKAYQPSMDRFVAIKVLPRQYAEDVKFISRFNQEARTLAKLQHPHILPVFDFGESEGFTYLVTPLLQGGTLKDILTGKPLPLELANKVISQVGEALDYAHSRHIIHRDVKPSNVLMDESGNCILADFGIAKLLEGSIRLTQSGEAIGTPAYMAPEQGQGKPVDARTDIYALGIMLYQMLTGKPPFDAETPAAVIIKHIIDPLVPPSELNPAISEQVEAVILKALAKNPDDRFATAGQMVKKLQDVVNHELAQNSLERIKNTGNRQINPEKKNDSRRWFIGIGLMLLVVFIIIGGLTYWRINTETNLVKPTPAVQSGSDLTLQSTPLALPGHETVPALSLKKMNITNVSDNPGKSIEPLIATDSGGAIHIVWKDDYSPHEIGFFHKALNPDGSWGKAIPLTLGFNTLENMHLIRNPQGQVCAYFEGMKPGDHFLLTYMTCFSGDDASPLAAITDKYDLNVVLQYTPQGKIEFIRDYYEKTTNIYFGAGEDLISDGYKSASNKSFIIDRDGIYHVFWLSQGNPVNVLYRSSRDGGKSWEPIENISGNMNISSNYALSSDNNGNIYGLFGTYSEGNVFAKWNRQSGWSLDTIKSAPTEFLYFDMATDSQGHVFIIWDSINGCYYIYQLDDETWSQPFELPIDYSSLTMSINNFKMALDAQNRVHLVWSTSQENNDIYHLMIPD